METRQIKYFIAVAEELHFGKAAKRLHISQPPLSQQIKKFEEELGVILFKRTKRSVSLTSAGKNFLTDARKIMGEIEQAKLKLQGVAAGTGGRLKLGYIAPALDTPLTTIIKQFKIAYPGVQLVLKEMTTLSQLEVLQKGDIDLGVVRLFKHNTKGLYCKNFHQQSYALILPSNHHLASKKSIEISELAGEEFIFFPRDSQPQLFDRWMMVFQQYGFAPQIVQEATTKAATMALVAAGIGISIVPESLAHRAPDQVIFKTLRGDFPTLEIHIVYGKNNNHPARDNFLQIAEEYSKK